MIVYSVNWEKKGKRKHAGIARSSAQRLDPNLFLCMYMTCTCDRVYAYGVNDCVWVV
jgi:hypothetical protein